MKAGHQRTLAFWSCASATQAPASAAAIISGRALDNRKAVARLMGKRRSPASVGGSGIWTVSPPGGGGNSKGDFLLGCGGRSSGEGTLSKGDDPLVCCEGMGGSASRRCSGGWAGASAGQGNALNHDSANTVNRMSS